MTPACNPLASQLSYTPSYAATHLPLLASAGKAL